MEQADSCRRAASEAIADVEPPQLYDFIEATLDEASMVPGVLTLESAAAAAPDGNESRDLESELPASRSVSDREHDRDTEHGTADDSPTDHERIATQAAGVQLIYEGLRLTRSLAHDEPWTSETDGRDGDTGDLEILAADILVARGFYLLARTDAASKAVRTVQAFGRDQTRRETAADPVTMDANLERDILELAVLTGTAAVGTTPSPRLLATAESLADTAGTTFPPATECLDDPVPPLSERSLEDHTTDRATSATDH
ncbi:DUF7114 family protein [Natronorubrum aibiense]|uniref:Uncharacterized protein n=1 Tax=Natronorubrum aibiense TaxID=348826 RepID=A0A5P9P0P5_9EURY|nr:hypothetical protein [Natronorubrum aibiense]QFU81705.1 hypothetical protein GCU68_03575 [Natronorubrum aibiense]